MRPNKIFVLNVILCLIFMCSIITNETKNLTDVQAQTTVGNTLYVGGSGPGNYTSIQDAINDANDGDTVFVYNGLYFEHIVIFKTIDLIGENRNTTIIDGGESGTVIRVSVDWVNITGFTVRKGDYDFSNAVMLLFILEM